jgi:outer membrane biosynthesis protein TonB
MRHIAQVLLMLFLLNGPLIGYTQTPEAPPAPNESVVPSPSTPQTQQTPEKTTQPSDNPSAAPAPAPTPQTKTTKAKRKRGHLSGFDIGVIVASGFLLIIVLGPLGGR